MDLRALIETDLVFPVKVGNKPAKIYRTVDEVTRHFTSSKPMIRRAAYVSLLSTYKKNIEKFFLIYQAVVKNWNNEANIRGYKSPISIRNFANNIPDEVTSKLIDVCVKNKSLFHRYFEFKAKELRVKKLKRFDIYAPIPKHEERSYSYNQSVNIVLSVLGDFCNTFKVYAERIINENHIDVYPRPNKTSGAFCSSVTPNITPYVLLNFTGRKRDVMTMAHELGHGIHGIYSNKNRLGAYHANLPLSETASTFSEMLVFESLINNAKTVQERKALLFEKMADSYATILRQCYFVKFELIAHRSIKEGITPEELSNSYFSLLKEQFGNVVDIDPLFRYEWAYIPHIVVNPFYCYAYNFGELLSLALFARYKKEGSNFVHKIEKILSYGGSKDPQEVLREVGVDITSRSFWQSSFNILDSWQTQLDGG